MKLTRKNLELPFAALNGMGYFARQNWKCCQSCGCAAVPEDKPYFVFYHEQDSEKRKDGYCYLTWEGNGHEICEVFKASGFDTEWDGKAETRIKVLARTKRPLTVDGVIEKAKKNIYRG
jgi:hypothetical protein